MRMLSIILIMLSIAGCAGQPSAIHDVQTVKVPVSVKCAPDIPAKPSLHTDAEIKAMGDYEAAVTLLRDRILREIYENNLEAALEGCK